MLLTIIAVIFFISFLVFVHEFGHYLGARMVGVKVLEFSIGFPPKVISRVVGGTEYMISAIPIGGYVRMLGQNIDDENPNEPGNYASKSIIQRLIIIIGGPIMNLVVAFLLMPIVFWVGYEVPAYLTDKPVVYSVIKESPADKLGIRKDDQIIKVNNVTVTSWRDVSSELQKTDSAIIELAIVRDGEHIFRRASKNLINDFSAFGWQVKINPVIGTIADDSAAAKAGFMKGDLILQVGTSEIALWDEISPALQASEGENTRFFVERGGEHISLDVKPDWNEENQYWFIGVTSQTVKIKESFASGIVSGSKRVVALTKATYGFLGRLIFGKEKTDNLGGPIMIAQMVGQAAHTDVSSFLALIAFISLQFCVFNLLPIPALDGGHVLFLIFEKMKGRALSENFRLNAQRVGFSVLMGLIVLISIQDSIRVFFR